MNKIIDKNIVLIGMPGSGKTTIGKEISRILNIPFVDADEYIENEENRKIKDIFEDGEDIFRQLETRAIKEIIKDCPIVIATGGGVIKYKRNIDFLKEQGIIIFLDRKPEDIVSDVSINERPLLKDGKHKVYNLYEERYHLYNKYCDIKVNAGNNVKEVVKDIIRSIYKE